MSRCISGNRLLKTVDAPAQCVKEYMRLNQNIVGGCKSPQLRGPNHQCIDVTRGICLACWLSVLPFRASESFHREIRSRNRQRNKLPRQCGWCLSEDLSLENRLKTSTKKEAGPLAFKYLAEFLLKQCNLAEQWAVEETGRGDASKTCWANWKAS